ncbi:biotin transporter BioY [Acetobacterium carbinolicum]|jgi:biotin transport system substrate-specific component|uniref:biotin transporter BioY n=1 Tax=Acetobacterium TaxID=33951 RepID=UPI0029E4516B|nr:biotin transporter BioY [Acetobacterium sp. K1/6]MDK2941417.1 biotin transport system substrate-specific component [Acetobacterium sp.]MDZ5725420.1 biotin transporter BioY [Acetobacterium sp. K1/6]
MIEKNVINKNTLSIRMLVLCGLFSALIVVGAMIKVPLPGIPLTLQTMFVLLAGLLLGSRGGLIAVLVYIFMGLVGVPVFTGGGGLMYVLKPTFGYIVGFALGAFVTGWLAERNPDHSTKQLILAAVAGTAVIYAVGLPWYYVILNYYLNTPVGAATVMMSGFVMTLPGGIIKIALSVLLAKRLAPVIGRGMLTK